MNQPWNIGAEIEAFFATDNDRGLLADCRTAFDATFTRPEDRTVWEDSHSDWPDSSSCSSARLDHLRTLVDELDLADESRAERALGCLTYLALGNYGDVGSKDAWLNRVRANCALLVAAGALDSIGRRPLFQWDSGPAAPSGPGEPSNPAAFSMSLSILYVVTTVAIELCEREQPTFFDAIDVENSLSHLQPLCNLVTSLAEHNKDDLRIAKTLLMLRNMLKLICPIATVKEHLRVERYTRAHLKPPLGNTNPKGPTANPQRVTPVDYLRFVAHVRLRYPEVVLPKLDDLLPLDGVPWHFVPGVVEAESLDTVIAFRDPLGATDPEPGTGLLEAFRVFASGLFVRLADVQIARERYLLSKEEIYGVNSADLWGEHDDSDELPALRICDETFGVLLPILPTLSGVLVRLLYYTNLGAANTTSSAPDTADPPVAGDGIVQQSESGSADAADGQAAAQRRQSVLSFEAALSRELVSYSVASIMLLLARIAKQTHVLRFEHVCQLLHDNNCPILILKLLSTWFQPKPEFQAPQQAGLGSSVETIAPSESAEAPPPPSTAPLPNWLQPKELLPELGHFRSPSWANYDEPPEFSRNLETAINLLDVLHKLTKRKPSRIGALVQWKASAVLKRILRVELDSLTMRALKILKSQVPLLGKKWRNANMKVLTAIYLNMNLDFFEPTVSDESSTDAEASAMEEENLRSLIEHYLERVSGGQEGDPLPTHEHGNEWIHHLY